MIQYTKCNTFSLNSKFPWVSYWYFHLWIFMFTCSLVLSLCHICMYTQIYIYIHTPIYWFMLYITYVCLVSHDIEQICYRCVSVCISVLEICSLGRHALEILLNIFIYSFIKHLIYISLFPAEISIVLFNEPLMNSLRIIT